MAFVVVFVWEPMTSATAGQKVSLGVTSTAFTSYVTCTVYAPDGTRVDSFNLSASSTAEWDSAALPQSGTIGCGCHRTGNGGHHPVPRGGRRTAHDDRSLSARECDPPRAERGGNLQRVCGRRSVARLHGQHVHHHGLRGCRRSLRCQGRHLGRRVRWQRADQGVIGPCRGRHLHGGPGPTRARWAASR